jgi:hypothetical protein
MHSIKGQIVVRDKQIICTAFSKGRTHDFNLFKSSETRFSADDMSVTDKGYVGIGKLHGNSLVPLKKSKKRPLSKQDKSYNKVISLLRVSNEHAFREVKIFRIFSGVYRNRRKRFGLRFNLVSAISNRITGF